MAHDCLLCGNTCRCGGDIDDLLLPNPNCKGCSCERDEQDDTLIDFECGGPETPIIFGDINPRVKNDFHCLECGYDQDHEGDCERCGGSYIDHQPQ